MKTINLIITFACFALCQALNAVSPPPDGGYPGNNTAEGTSALLFRTSGIDDTALGFQALYFTTTGNFNTGTGFRALFRNTSGQQNTATGVSALYFNTTGSFNTANGNSALFANSTGVLNTATGVQALFHNSTGAKNTATGVQALFSNTDAPGNTATGYRALFRNTTGDSNTAFGAGALMNNVDGSVNNAVGFNALSANVSGFFNNAHGRSALENNTESENNAFGDLAMESNTTGFSNTAIGDDALINNTTGSFNVAVGDEAGTGLGVDVNNCIAIGAPGAGPFAGFDNTCFIGSIFGEPVSDPGSQVPVYVDQFNVVGVFNSSSRTIKHDIKPMDKASETIYQFKPVTFKYNSDWKGTTQYGLIAEEVAEVDPQLVVRGRDGEIMAVHYEQISNMLLNEFLKEHRKVEEQASTIRKQEKTIAELKEQMESVVVHLKKQDAKIQRVSDQVEINKPTEKLVRNER
jgi:hypothetical protein